MARYTTEHKANTRAHIIETARNEFRINGFDRASIDKLMAAAGLTRGGFYAHFDSKEDLICEVLAIEPGLLTSLGDAVASATPRAEAAQAIKAYLDPAADDLIQCPLVAHPIDALRGGSDRAALYSHQVEDLVARFGDIIGPDRSGDAVLAAIVTVGSALLGTATAGNAISEQLQAVGAAKVLELLESGGGA